MVNLLYPCELKGIHKKAKTQKEPTVNLTLYLRNI